MYETESESSSSDSRSLSSSLDNLVEEFEDLNALGQAQANSSGSEHGLPNEDDPIADEEYAAAFDEAREERKRRKVILKDRFDGKIRLEDWCKCGHCSLGFAQNAEECNCCQEIDRCVIELQSEQVLQDTEGAVYTCITDHPGFAEVCLGRWSLKCVSKKYRTRDHKAYKQKSTENEFLRSVAYRQFVGLVYGRLGKKRIPLPACTYTAIRRRFASQRQDGQYSGYANDEGH